jgi:hypothetical protein
MKAIHKGQIAYCDLVRPRDVSRIKLMSQGSSLMPPVRFEICRKWEDRVLGFPGLQSVSPIRCKVVSIGAKVRQDF